MTTEKKLRIIVVGGRPNKLQRELYERFDIVNHIVDRVPHTLPRNADYVFIIVPMCSLSMARRFVKESPLPIVKLTTPGWTQIERVLIEKGILKPESAPVAPPMVTTTPPTSEPATVTGIPPEKLWEHYGARCIEALRAVMKPGEKATEAVVVEVLELAALPADDARLLLPELQMRGVLGRAGERWKLMSNDAVEYDLDTPDVDPPPVKVPKGTPPEDSKKTARALALKGLPMGPYSSKAQIIHHMKRFREFLHPIHGGELGHATYDRTLTRAIELHVIEQHHGRWYVDHADTVVLTPAKKEVGHAV